MEMKKIGILFGGKSGEHEISILSAASVIEAIDRSRYEVFKVGINKRGDWFRIETDMRGLTSLDDDRFDYLIPQTKDGGPGAEPLDFSEFIDTVDFVFPVLHGPYGEDGTIQGMLETMGVPYAGCGVTASALAMDKIFTKEILLRAGFHVTKHEAITKREYETEKERCLRKIEASLCYPLFVKPANLGSSVGISKVSGKADLAGAIESALRYDKRILVEEGVVARELEVAVLGNDDPEAGGVGEVSTTNAFYDYDAKYKDESITKLDIPAVIPKEIEERVRALAKEVFSVLDGAGFSRVDFLWDEAADIIYVNEINTIPGFTKFSMFPSLWGISNVDYPTLIERIIELGYERYHAKNNR
jgi:D-alanine-D-alanine ligase